MKTYNAYDKAPRESLQARRARQQFEGSQAMKKYRRSQEAARERMRALREERLAREAKQQES